MNKSVRVHCSVQNGVILHLDRIIDGDMGLKRSERVGPAVTLRAGINEGIDAEFMRQWMADNAGNSLVSSGSIHIEE